MKKQILFTESEIKNKVGEIAHNLKKREHDFPPVFICVLNGAFMFFTDLVKRVGECEIDFIRAKSYTGITQTSVSISKSIESISAKCLKRIALPSITGFEASGPISPKPKTAVPFEITATRFPLAVYLYTLLTSFAISKHGSATPGE